MTLDEMSVDLRGCGPHSPGNVRLLFSALSPSYLGSVSLPALDCRLVLTSPIDNKWRERGGGRSLPLIGRKGRDVKRKAGKLRADNVLNIEKAVSLSPLSYLHSDTSLLFPSLASLAAFKMGAEKPVNGGW